MLMPRFIVDHDVMSKARWRISREVRCRIVRLRAAPPMSTHVNVARHLGGALRTESECKTIEVGAVARIDDAAARPAPAGHASMRKCLTNELGAFIKQGVGGPFCGMFREIGHTHPSRTCVY